MALTQEQIEELEAALEALDMLDPAELPQPAAELAEVLGRVLEDLETD